ncbi:MAG: hypothetical protein QM770_01135 [Tepidisphaeraceae bacterium]
MSAFLLSRGGLSNLAFEFVRRNDDGQKIGWRELLGWWHPQPQTLAQRYEAVFQLLLQHNLRSLKVRYGIRSLDDHRRAADWHFLPPSPAYLEMPVGQHLLAILADCFDYQACEVLDYDRTKAHAIMCSIRGDITRREWSEADYKCWGSALPGYVAERERGGDNE